MKRLQFNQLSYRYPQSKRVAISDLTLDLDGSRIYGLIGQNGAGKTTLMRLIAGLVSPQIGKGDQVVVDNSWFSSEETAYLIEQPGVYKHLSAREYLEFYRSIYQSQANSNEKQSNPSSRITNYPKRLTPELLDELQALFQFQEMDVRCDKLSLGNKQKLQLIRCFWTHAGCLILDEPTANLDPIAQDAFWKHILELQQSNTCVIISSHQLNDLIEYCDQFIFIDGGQMIQNLSRQSILKQQKLPLEFLQEFEHLKSKFRLEHLELKDSWTTWYQNQLKAQDGTV